VVIDTWREQENEDEPRDEGEAEDHPDHGYVSVATGKCSKTSAARRNARPSS
jgi:hypothetical protein